MDSNPALISTLKEAATFGPRHLVPNNQWLICSTEIRESNKKTIKRTGWTARYPQPLLIVSDGPDYEPGHLQEPGYRYVT